MLNTHFYLKTFDAIINEIFTYLSAKTYIISIISIIKALLDHLNYLNYQDNIQYCMQSLFMHNTSDNFRAAATNLCQSSCLKTCARVMSP